MAARQSVVVALLFLFLLLLLLLLVSHLSGADAAVVSLVGLRFGGCQIVNSAIARVSGISDEPCMLRRVECRNAEKRGHNDSDRDEELDGLDDG